MSVLHTLDGGAAGRPLSVALSIIPSLPRPLLSRLVERAIERMDEMDGDPDREPDEPSEDDHDREEVVWSDFGSQAMPEAWWVRRVTVSDL